MSIGDRLSGVSPVPIGEGYVMGFAPGSPPPQVVGVSDLPDVTPGNSSDSVTVTRLLYFFFFFSLSKMLTCWRSDLNTCLP